MSTLPVPRPDEPEARPRESPLETVTSVVLLFVMAALVWVALAAFWPDRFGLAERETEVVALLVLLTVALLLVSAVALLNTRQGDAPPEDLP